MIRHILIGVPLALLTTPLVAAGPAGAEATTPPSAPAAPVQPADPVSKPGALDAVLGDGRRQGSRVSGDDFLPVDQAFRLYATADGPDHARLNWQIADGYYLYRSRIRVTADAGPVHLGPLKMPAGQVKTDEYLGRQVIYHHELDARLPLLRAAAAPATDLILKVTYQGCAEAGLCYPPTTKEVTLHLPAGGAPAGR
ncbi:MAG: hypothetical protein JSR67_01715 [Proteobacteria bacterium]|nr:hypothetical protein [Pseudomonadota bacterium]